MAYDRDRTFLVGIASRLVGSHQYQRLSLFASVLEDCLQQRKHSAFESESRPRWPDPSQGWSPCQRGVARSLCALHAARAIKTSPETQASCSRCRIVKLSRYCHGRILEYSYLFLYYMQQQCPNKLPVKFSEKKVSDGSFKRVVLDRLTARGVAHLVVHGTSGSTSYETIPPIPLETSVGVLSTEDMVVQRCDGPRRLRDNDDDV